MKKSQKIGLVSVIVAVIICSASVTSGLVYKKLKPEFELLSYLSDKYNGNFPV